MNSGPLAPQASALARLRHGPISLLYTLSSAHEIESCLNLIARMKILSSDAVIEAAEKAGRLILDTYLSPNRTFVDLPDLINEMDPLRDFSEACRRELQSADRR